MNVRNSFWRGIIAGSIMGAAISMMAGGRRRNERKSFLGYQPKQARTQAQRVLRGVTRTVNDLIR